VQGIFESGTKRGFALSAIGAYAERPGKGNEIGVVEVYFKEAARITILHDPFHRAVGVIVVQHDNDGQIITHQRS